MTRDEWLDAFARRLGVSTPSLEQVDGLLAIAAAAAHASERTAAPVACWLVASSNVAIGAALDIAMTIEHPE